MNTNKLRCPVCGNVEQQRALTEEEGTRLSELLLIHRGNAHYWRSSAFFCPFCQLPHLELWPFETERAAVLELLRGKPKAQQTPTIEEG